MVEIPALPNSTPTLIDEKKAAEHQPNFSVSIGASMIGHDCERNIFYRFRWACLPQKNNGRLVRLLETGKLEETRMIGWLKDIGVNVAENDPETGRQWMVIAVDGHLKGFADGIILDGLPGAEKTKHLLECKTHSLASFKQLQKHGVAVAKPDHVAQMQIYMHLLGLTRALYFAKCKDNDELYAERIKYDAAHALALLGKAERIVNASEKPARVSDNPNFYLCKAYNCPAFKICHENDFAVRNCRTCIHSTPIAGGGWRCERLKIKLNTQDQKAGCPHHLFLPCLVPGEQIDADEKKETITYRLLKDNKEWIDGGGK